MTEPPSAPRAGPDPSKFRAVRLLPDGRLQKGGVELLEGEGPFWLDLTGQGASELELLGLRFGFHPLALEDCAHLDQRPKLEEFDGHLFLVQHAFTMGDGPDDLALHELHAFLGKGFLVTVHADPMPDVDAIFHRAAAEPATLEHGPDFALYLLCDRMTDRHFEVLDHFAERIDELEDSILTSLKREEIQEVFAIKRALVSLRRTLSPARDVFGLLAKRGSALVGERTAFYFRDVYDHLVRVCEAIESDRDLLGNALEAYLSMSANRTNNIMKQLTIFSVTFLPLTFITGFFGMNFTAIMPFERPWLFLTMLAACVGVPASMLWWFLRKRWV